MLPQSILNLLELGKFNIKTWLANTGQTPSDKNDRENAYETILCSEGLPQQCCKGRSETDFDRQINHALNSIATIILSFTFPVAYRSKNILFF